ncbi:ankyrin repeat domain-containing protein, partial [Verrucomicrobia bacterium]|nr:ankyrin repeat domain-containing protein [Verrucomicrobiota bacterium]
NIRAVKRHLAAGADVNAKGEHGFTPLHAVCGRGTLWFGHMDIIELLIAKGADVNAKTKFGTTSLALATVNGHNETVVLRKHGAKTWRELKAEGK